jgi:predicted nucleotidyltransferase
MADLDDLVEQGTALLKSMGARRVYLFGSVARGNARKDSDLDLAVEGLPPETFYRTLAQLNDLTDRQVDLIDLDEVNPFTAYLKEKGLLRRVA